MPVQTKQTLKPRKIVGVISFMNAAGAQEALLRLGRQLRARGHDMEVWFLYEEDKIHQNEPAIRVFFHKPALSMMEYLHCFWRLYRALKQEKPDAVIGFLPLGNVFGMAAAALAGVPLRIASQRAPGNTFGSVMRKLDRMLGTIGVYQEIVCVSNAVEDSFAGYPAAYRKKLRVVHNGIDWTPSPSSKAEARAKLDLPADKFLAIAIGRMKTQKNYEFLLRSFAGAPDVTLAIAGDGAQRPELEALAKSLGIAERVIFLGALDRGDIRELLRAADMFVQASLYEGQSNAVLEAMHEGLPILVSDIPSQRESVLDDSGSPTALLAPLGDLEAWSDALVTLRDDAAMRATLGKRALETVTARFGLGRMIDGFESVIQGRAD
jgi:glycosyltransferase involved in cell wall biosynthesis